MRLVSWAPYTLGLAALVLLGGTAAGGDLGGPVGGLGADTSIAASGPHPAADSSQYVTRSWTTEERLPQNSVWALEQTGDGALWVGTLGGLARFDGRDFTSYNAASNEGLVGNRIRALQEGSDGTLWVGTESGLSVRQNEAFQSVNGPAYVEAIDKVPEGRTVWIGGEAGLYRSHPDATGGEADGRVERVSTARSPGRLNVDDVEAVAEDSVWAVARGELFLYSDGTVDQVPILEERATGIRRVASGPRGRLWVATVSALFATDGDSTTRYPVQEVWAIEFGSSGTVWGATWGNGLFQISGGTVRRVETVGEFPSQIAALERDHSGQLWAGSVFETGLIRLRRRLFHTIKEPVRGSVIHGVYADSAGTVWTGSQSGAYRIGKGTATHWTAENGLTNSDVYAVHRDDTGALWLSAADEVFRRREGELGRVRFRKNQPFRGFSAMHRDSRGTLWIGGRLSGLFRYREGTLRRVLSPESFEGTGVLALHHSSDGTLWIGTGGKGVARYRNGSLTWYGRDDGVPYGRVRDIYETSDGAIWIATYGGGIARFEDATSGTSFTPVTPEDGLPTGAIHTIYEAPEGIFWMTSNDGVFRVSRAQVEAVADGRRERLYVQSFGSGDGMPSRECNGNFQPAIAEGPNGRLWIPTISGLTLVDSNDPRLAVPDSIPVQISSARVDGTSRSLDSLRLAPSSYRLAVDFSATSLRFAEDLSFRYRLDKGDWTPARGRRTAEFTNLDAGRHRFEVQATLNGETWYTQSEPLRFTVAPHFYETGWFRLLVVLGLFGLLGAAYAWRTRALRRRQQKLQRMVEARTEQLVEEKKKTEAQAERLEALDRQKNRFFANISHELRTPLTILTGTAQDLLEGAFGELPAPARRQLEIMHGNIGRLRRLADQLLDLSRLETADPELNDEPRDLALLLHQAVRSFVPLAERRGVDLRLDTTVETHPCRVDPEKLEKIVGNLLSNALKNTPEGGEVRVTLGVEEEDPEEGDPPVTVLRVADTGRGIAPERQGEIFERFAHAGREDTDRNGTGIGLSLVREYVGLHGGTIALDSTPGEGSTFTVRLPLSPADPTAVETDGLSETEEAPQIVPDEEPAPPGGNGAPEEDDRPTLLVVEDNADVRAYLRRHLRETYHVVEAAGGAEGLETAREIEPDLLITDLMMPEMDGIELCQQIRSEDALAPVPIVLLTARAAEEDAVAGLEAGADAYVTKPFSIEELKARLRRLLNAHWTGTAGAPAGEPLAPDVEVTSADEEFLGRVTDAIDEHLSHTDFTVEDLAAEVGLSPRQLRRKLKRLTGETPAAFVRKYRLDVAAKLLEAETSTVSEVGYEVGFGTPETFATRFEERFGCPPSAYPEEASSVPNSPPSS